MYIPIHSVLADTVTMFMNFHYDLGRQGLEIYPCAYQVSSSTVFFFISYMHIYVYSSIGRGCLLFSKILSRMMFFTLPPEIRTKAAQLAWWNPRLNKNSEMGMQGLQREKGSQGMMHET